MRHKSSYARRVRTAEPMTAEELLALNLPNRRTELVRGRLVVSEPAGFHHGDIAMRIAVLIEVYARAHNLGRVFAAETGFKLFSKPDTVRAPDVAFIRRERLPDPPPRGFAAFAPDLAVEVLSPDDRPGEVQEKVDDWLGGGAALVWVVDPMRRTARVHRADGTKQSVDTNGALDGEGVLPGFSLPLSELA
jgi:Uma2 family endonuclease